jgi:hypothetical protein
MSDLTNDQRWLLYFMGGWQIRDCLIGPAGTDHLMQSTSGACRFTGPEGGPEWMTCWDTRNGKIVSPGRGESRVVVTKAQINAYARSRPRNQRGRRAPISSSTHRRCRPPRSNPTPTPTATSAASTTEQHPVVIIPRDGGQSVGHLRAGSRNRGIGIPGRVLGDRRAVGPGWGGGCGRLDRVG